MYVQCVPMGPFFRSDVQNDRFSVVGWPLTQNTQIYMTILFYIFSQVFAQYLSRSTIYLYICI